MGGWWGSKIAESEQNRTIERMTGPNDRMKKIRASDMYLLDKKKVLLLLSGFCLY